MGLTVVDKGMERIHRELERAGRSKVLVGWQGSKGAEQHPGSDATNAEIAAMMEYGTRRMPARPAIAIAEERNRGELIQLAQVEAGKIAEGGDVRDMLEAIGESGLNALKVAIEDAEQWAAPLADSTIEAKGGLDTPWIDTGTLYDTAEAVIEEAARK